MSAPTRARWWRVHLGAPARPLVSLRLPRRGLGVIAVALAVALAAFVLTLLTGDYQLAPGQVVAAVLGHGDPGATLIVDTFRLPRAVTALLVGAALGLSGAIFQSLARNPLVAPDVIGVNSGAGLAALLALYVTDQLPYLPAAAFLGGLTTAVIAAGLAYTGRIHQYRMLIIGVGINALAGAGISYILLLTPPDQVAAGYQWLLGTLDSTDGTQLLILAVSLAILVPLLALTLPVLDVLSMGDDLAAGLGVGVRRARLGLIVAGVGLAAVGVAFTGPIGFVGFLCPNIARRLTRSTGATHALAAAATGAALTLLADLVAARVLAPTELPVGVVTVALGGPYFLWLLLRTPRRARS